MAHEHPYLSLSGGTMTGALTVKQYIFGYNYNHAGGNAPAFLFDKPGSYYTGIGANGETDTIYFSAATITDGEASWVTSYKQKWKFNGTIYQENNAVIHAGNIGSQSVSYATSAGNADTVDSQHFSYSNDSNSPTYLWATNSNGSSFLAARGSISVNYANSAGSASTVTVNSSDANSTYRMVWHSGNTLYGTGGIYCNPSTDALYASAFYETSDIRLKQNINPVLTSNNIPQIKEFDWKNTGKHSYGLIAQELESMGYSELVDTKDDGYKSVNYTAALCLIIGKLQLKIKELEDRIKYLESK